MTLTRRREQVKRRGRPVKTTGRYDRDIHVRMTDDQYRLVRTYCETEGMTLSRLVRQALDLHMEV